MRITDKQAVRIGLRIAIDAEMELIDCYGGNRSEKAVIDAERRIVAFRRVLERYYRDGRSFHEIFEDRVKDMPMVEAHKIKNTSGKH